MDKKKVKELMSKAKEHLLAYQRNSKNSDLAMAFLNLQNAEREFDKSDWVSVEDGLPPYKEKVFACDKQMKDYPFVTMRYNTDEKNVLDKNGFRSGLHVTHWKPIEKLEE